RLAADRHLDDDIHLVRRVGPKRDRVDTHGNLRKLVSWPRPGSRRRPRRPHEPDEAVPLVNEKARDKPRHNQPYLSNSDVNASNQCVQLNATLSRFLPPNRSDERATMRPPRLR